MKDPTPKHKPMNRKSGCRILMYILPCLLFLCSVTAQEVQIRVVSEWSEEPLAQAYGQNLRNAQYAIADEDGFLRIIAVGGDTVRIGYVGYRDTALIILDSVRRYTIHMAPAVQKEVVVFGEQDVSRDAALGLQNVPMEFLQVLPGLTGETDILKSLTFLPGVTGGQEGYSHLLVRGGQQDQNLILLDGATLFNVNHALGFISLFNTSIISHVDFYKSYWPSLYGGRLSSVLDVQTKRGNKNQREGSIDLGLVTSKIDLSGPLSQDGRTSYSVGVRTTLLDLIFLSKRRKISKKKVEGNAPGFAFYDLNAKIDHRFSEEEVLSLSFYHGSDMMSGNSYEIYGQSGSYHISRFGLRNWAATANYSKVLNVAHSFYGHLSYSSHRNYFENNVHRDEDTYGQYTHSTFSEQLSDNDILSLKGRVHGKYYFSETGRITYGLETERFTYGFGYRIAEGLKNRIEETEQRSADALKGPETWLVAPFLDGEIKLSSAFRLKGGIRMTRFAGEEKGKWLPEPKAMLVWKSGPRSTFRFAYNRQHQPIHLLAYNNEGFFMENFILSDGEIPPSSSHQFSTGFFRSFPRLLDNFSLEFYYKKQKDVVKYMPPQMDFPSVLSFRPDLFLHGKVESYGAELMTQKTSGDFHGSLSYSLAYARSEFPGLNLGKPFPSDFDYRNQVNALMIYQINDNYRLSAQWTYLSGRPVTWSNEEAAGADPVLGTYSYEIYKGLNNTRLPAYHRLDMGLRRDRISYRTGKKYWFALNIYNAYFRKNPYTLIRNGDQWKIRSIFPIIPSVNLGFEL